MDFAIGAAMINENNEIVKKILKAIYGVKFGEVVIKIQDSNIVCIERLEKIRLDKSNPN